MDEIFSRYVFVVDFIIIIVFAAFLAASIDHMLGAHIDGALARIRGKEAPEMEGALERHEERTPKGAAAAGFTPVDGKAILGRNFFDSETGPLDQDEIRFPVFVEEGPPAGLTADDFTSLPPRCSANIKVVGLFASDDPAWAFTAIESEGKTIIKGIGDVVQGFRINDITWKYIFLGQQGGSGSCYMDIWEAAGAGMPRPPGPPGAIASKAAMRASEGDMSMDQRRDFQEMLERSIQEVSPTEKNVDKSLLQYLMQNKEMLMQSGRILPNLEEGEINGFKVYGIRKTSLWGKLGIQNGDIVHSVNGIGLSGPEAAMEAISKFESTDRLTVNVTRRGNNMNLDFNIK